MNALAEITNHRDKRIDLKEVKKRLPVKRSISTNRAWIGEWKYCISTGNFVGRILVRSNTIPQIENDYYSGHIIGCIFERYGKSHNAININVLKANYKIEANAIYFMPPLVIIKPQGGNYLII
ncbi:MAG TPA: hypothetical protein VM123_14065 [archaeon]|nr:hypothetical protein [archaeon]